MTKKDYIAIANAIRDNQVWTDDEGVLVVPYNDIIWSLIEVFEEDNKLFDRNKFISATNL